MKMRSDYYHGYKDILKFTRKVDSLGERQRRIHAKIQNLENICNGNVKEFRRKFGPLRVKTFKNLRIGEKMIFQDKKLKSQFAKQVRTSVSLYTFSQIITIIHLAFLSPNVRYTTSIIKTWKNVLNVLIN